MPVTQLRDLATLTPRPRSIMRDEETRRFRAGEFSIGNVGMEGEPTYMPMRKSGTRTPPGLPRII